MECAYRHNQNINVSKKYLPPLQGSPYAVEAEWQVKLSNLKKVQQLPQVEYGNSLLEMVRDYEATWLFTKNII